MSIFQRDELKAQNGVVPFPQGGETEARRPARGNPEELHQDASAGLLEEVFVTEEVDQVWEMINSDSNLTQEKAYELIRDRADSLRSELVELAYSRKGGLEFSIDEGASRRAENPSFIERGQGALQGKGKALFNHKSKSTADRLISKNLELSRRFSRFQAIYIGGAIASALIVIAALFVDFHIIKEFWHSALVNEYMQLPPELAGSVWFKSFQVLFATIGIHLFLRILPAWGRNVFVAFLFVLTVAMMLSLGFLYAHNTLPNENQATIEGRDTSTSSLGSALASLGLEPDNTSVNAAKPPVELPQWMEQLAVYDAFGWMVSLSVIFFLVASIGALFLIWTEEGIQKFAVGRDYQNRLVRTQRLRLLDSVAFQLR